MAQKATTAEARVEAARFENMEFKIQGLEVVDEREGVFRLMGVQVVDVDWKTIGETLEQAGISTVDAERYVDTLADEVNRDMIAKVFAQRAKRIG
jgi:hypothetical protein